MSRKRPNKVLGLQTTTLVRKSPRATKRQKSFADIAGYFSTRSAEAEANLSCLSVDFVSQLVWCFLEADAPYGRT